MKKVIKVASVVAIMSMLSGCIIEHDHDRGWGHGRGGGWHHGHGGWHRR
ncbi:hypothetical protein [Candidatus Pantoea soli]|nr:hypothetical protein [Pantoea soli]